MRKGKRVLSDLKVFLEIEVSDFEETNRILNELGYRYRNRQENLRHVFMLDNAEISIDTWPRIQPYAEIEADTKDIIFSVFVVLNFAVYNQKPYHTYSLWQKIWSQLFL